MPDPTWELLYVLDSLDLRAAFETEYLVFTGRDDARVASAIATHPAAERLLDGFTDAAGRKKRVSALVMRTDTPAVYRDDWVVRSLRNTFAFCSVTTGCQAHLTEENGRGFWVLYSSFFRFYPLHLSGDGRHIITVLPAYHNLDEIDGFSGQVSPDLPNTSMIEPLPDRMLVQRLVEAWGAMVGNVGNPRLAALFRSLDVAFHAASVTETFSAYEFGIRVGLWVTAFEILANARSGRANLDTVLDMLRRITWNDAELERPCVTERRRGQNLVCGLYADLYKARNDYVHGNPASPERPFVFKDRDLPSLFHVAPLVFKAALDVYLHEHGFPRNEEHRLWEQPRWEEALLKAMPATNAVLA